MTTSTAAIPIAILATNKAQNQEPMLPIIARTNATTKATIMASHHNGFCHCAPNRGRRYAIAPPTKIPPVAAAAIGLNCFTTAITAVTPTITITLINHNLLLDITNHSLLLDIFSFFLAKGQFMTTCLVASSVLYH